MDFPICSFCGDPALFTFKDRKISDVLVCKTCRAKQTGSFKFIKEPLSGRKLCFKETVAPWIKNLLGDLPGFMVTITHKDMVSREFSRRKRNYWLNEVNRKIFGNHYDRKGFGLRSVFAFEIQQRGCIHQHGLVVGEELRDFDLKESEACLNRHAKGYCRIKRVFDIDGSIHYCFAHAFAKSDGCEFDIWIPPPKTYRTTRDYKRYYDFFHEASSTE